MADEPLPSVIDALNGDCCSNIGEVKLPLVENNDDTCAVVAFDDFFVEVSLAIPY